MINFYRRIRQNLLTESKFSKYLIYAIGEIILVVIGILIALYLNNRNESNTIHKQQVNYLMLIKQEMINNIKSLDTEKKELSQTLNSCRKTLNTINSDNQINNITEADLSRALALNISSDIIIQYENGALSQIIYSGGLKDIRNDSIRRILASWEGKINLVRLQEEQVNNAIEKVKNFITKYGEIRNIIEDLGMHKKLELDSSESRGSNKKILKSKEFENVLIDLFLTGHALHETEYPEFEKEMQSLINLINEELSEK
ncbi:DUF6090 family protein [Zobellia laminariae]|uniref:DUF6090 family protein n=1 Tax=Zobellia laminariae TaxID=248906 RepID=UPI0026F420E7|nr:DUF6090 family protein [Zobellia laminariae]WKX75882.1 DUF6090 family protein [Zobellia laminariae]